MWMFIIALIALVCWSGSDIFSKVGTKPNDKYSHFKVAAFVILISIVNTFFKINSRCRFLML